MLCVACVLSVLPVCMLCVLSMIGPELGGGPGEQIIVPPLIKPTVDSYLFGERTRFGKSMFCECCVLCVCCVCCVCVCVCVVCVLCVF